MNVSEKVKKNKKSFRSILRQEGKMDLTFFFLVIGLLVTGLIMLFSASAPYASNYHSNSYYFITRQLIFAIIGFALMMMFSRIKYKVLAKFAWIIAGVSVVLLILVLLLPEVKPGFKRWLDIGFIQFQPSEVAKFALILLLSYIALIDIFPLTS